MQAVLVKKEGGVVSMKDGFDTGVNTRNDKVFGGMVGALVGVLGGPIGVLLGGSYGALVGAAVDTADAVNNASLIEQIAGKMVDDEVAIIAPLAVEEEEATLDAKLSKYKGVIARFDAAVVAAEVDEAQMMADEMARQARAELRKEKKASFKQKIMDKQAKLSADCEEIWATYNKVQPDMEQVDKTVDAYKTFKEELKEL